MSLKVDNHLRRFSPRVLYRVTTSYTFEKNQATLPRHLGQEPKSLGEARRRHSLPRPLNQNLHKTEGDFDDRSSLRFYVAENLRVRNQCNRGRTPPFRHLINASLETPLEIHTRATRRRRAPKVIATTFVFDYTKLVPFSWQGRTHCEFRNYCDKVGWSESLQDGERKALLLVAIMRNCSSIR